MTAQPGHSITKPRNIPPLTMRVLEDNCPLSQSGQLKIANAFASAIQNYH
jgi:hypothetical protein